MIGWIIAAIAVFLWSPCPAFAQPLFSPTQDPVAGSDVFGSKGCLMCHSVDGSGCKSTPDLAQIKGLDSSATAISAMWNHFFLTGRQVQGQKDLWPQFRPDEMADLTAFLQTLGRGRT